MKVTLLVRFYRYIRTPAQIQWDFNRGAPIAWYKFDECSGSTAYDAALKSDPTTTRYDGTIYAQTGNNVGTCGGTAGDMWADGASGKYSSSLAFDATDDYVDIPDTGTKSTLDIPSGESETLSAWVKIYTDIVDGQSHVIASKGATDGTNDINYQLAIGKNLNSNGIYYCHHDASTNTHCYFASNGGGLTFTTDTWMHIVITYTNGTGSSIQAYFNGKPITGSWTTGDGDSPGVENNKDLWIGADDYSGCGGICEIMDGQIDDVRIYNYALTAAQVKTLYNNNSAVQF